MTAIEEGMVDDNDDVSITCFSGSGPLTTIGELEPGTGIGFVDVKSVEEIFSSDGTGSLLGRSKDGITLAVAGFCIGGGVIVCTSGFGADHKSKDGS